ncbi:MAG: glycosyltransferase [Flavobacteriaceae bacterium]|jgi:glycosyltransferase involved in cell wall biosynthesis
MIASDFSFIIPVFNRPEEIRELLESFCALESPKTFEIVIIEDGSTLDSKLIVDHFQDLLKISYYAKENTGPGHSRNYGMERAKGRYFIVLDSDCILPPTYLEAVISKLNSQYVDGFGGPDAAKDSFTEFQKAINFSMTSYMTTGGIRGGKIPIENYEPRSFNMGISKEAFQATGGFGRIHPGEDPDLSIRLKEMGYHLHLIPEAFVFHKRRINLESFYTQVNKFGQARPILNKWHPQSKRLTYWFPTFFTLGLLLSSVLSILGFHWFLIVYGLYFLAAMIGAFRTSNNIIVAFLVFPAIVIQFFGYGFGFLKATLKLGLSSKNETQLFPKLFFRAND